LHAKNVSKKKRAAVSQHGRPCIVTPVILGSGGLEGWDYTSDQAPVIVNTSIQDGGNSAAAGTLGVPEPTSMVLLATGAAGMFSYRLKRRKV
jgi:hypothetical protein